MQNPIPEHERSTLDHVWIELHKLGIESATVEFSGSGDSGQFLDYVEYSPEGVSVDDIDAIRIDTLQERQRHEKGSWVLEMEDVTLPINDVIFRLAGGFLPGGWEINEGSEGKVIFDVTNRNVVLEITPFVYVARDENKEDDEEDEEYAEEELVPGETETQTWHLPEPVIMGVAEMYEPGEE